jgi:hypothetical protein
MTYTDVLDVLSGALPGYPRGLLVVQDDGNTNKEPYLNFKLVNWSSVDDSAPFAGACCSIGAEFPVFLPNPALFASDDSHYWENEGDFPWA